MKALARLSLLTAALFSAQAAADDTPLARTGSQADGAARVRIALADPAPESLRLPRQSSRYPLHRAALQDDVAGVVGWVGRGLPIDIRDDEGRTPLMVAAAFGNVAAAEAILALGADPRLRDAQGEAPIHFAARAGKAAVVDLLIARGVDPDFRASPRSATALHYAATFGHERIVRLLAERGAEIDAADIAGITPLQYASRRNRYGLVEVFIELGARPQDLHDAVNADDVGRVLELIREGANIDEPDLAGPAINLAAAKGSLAMVRILADAGASLEASGDPAHFRPLHAAAMNGHAEIARFLLERGAVADSRDDWGRTPLMVAATHGSVEVARMLLGGGADARTEDAVFRHTAIHYAAMGGHQPVVALLLANGIPIDFPSGHDGESPLHQAAQYANLALVEFLVEQGADLHHVDFTGCTPLGYALNRGNKGTETEMLLRRLGATE